ncbi:MAG: lysophospholipid acyltransferase family protein [Proteobacteria bacterium]|jgi:1-acyl-sn-glycerol-3-phosphate acyltransferase|nr:lysophospholipid acyltransferase family protein [Pseudomonadota bacterium]
MNTWDNLEPKPGPYKLSVISIFRIFIRLPIIILIICSGSIVFSGIRILEFPLIGQNRVISGHVTRIVCSLCLKILGIRVEIKGAPMAHKGPIVSNHVSWLDIFVLNSVEKVYFVAKSEVARWPLIGLLAKMTGALFIRRKKLDSLNQIKEFEERLIKGQRLLFFPEGTSTDGLQVLPFKPTLFEALFNQTLKNLLWIQPVTLNYLGPSNLDRRFYAWWGDMTFTTHFFLVLSAKKGGKVKVIIHDPIKISWHNGRKELAHACYEIIDLSLKVE